MLVMATARHSAVNTSPPGGMDQLNPVTSRLGVAKNVAAIRQAGVKISVTRPFPMCPT
jgi:hypothetical protein